MEKQRWVRGVLRSRQQFQHIKDRLLRFRFQQGDIMLFIDSPGRAEVKPAHAAVFELSGWPGVERALDDSPPGAGSTLDPLMLRPAPAIILCVRCRDEYKEKRAILVLRGIGAREVSTEVIG